MRLYNCVRRERLVPRFRFNLISAGLAMSDRSLIGRVRVGVETNLLGSYHWNCAEWWIGRLQIKQHCMSTPLRRRHRLWRNWSKHDNKKIAIHEWALLFRKDFCSDPALEDCTSSAKYHYQATRQRSSDKEPKSKALLCGSWQVWNSLAESRTLE